MSFGAWSDQLKSLINMVTTELPTYTMSVLLHRRNRDLNKTSRSVDLIWNDTLTATQSGRGLIWNDTISPHGQENMIRNHGLVVGLTVFIGVFILFTNSSAIVFLQTRKDTRLKSRLSMMLTLSLNDIIIGITTSFGALIVFVKESANVYECALVLFGIEFGLTASLFHTFFICLERYLAMRSKFFHEGLLKLRGQYKLLAISWLIIGVYFGLLKIVTPSSINICTYASIYGKYHHILLSFNLFGIWIPLLIGTLILYAVAIWRLQRQMRVLDIITKQRTDDEQQRSPNHLNQLFTLTNTGQQDFTTRQQRRMNMKYTKTEQYQNELEPIQEHSNSHYPQGLKSLNNTEDRNVTFFSSMKEENIQMRTMGTTSTKKLQNDESNDERRPIDMMNPQNMLNEKQLHKGRAHASHSRKTDHPQRNWVTDMQTATANSRRLTLRAIKTVGLIVLVLTLTTGVGLFILAIDTLCTHCTISMKLRQLTSLCWFANSAFNPVIYLCTIKEFRVAFRRTFKCKFR